MTTTTSVAATGTEHRSAVAGEKPSSLRKHVESESGGAVPMVLQIKPRGDGVDVRGGPPKPPLAAAMFEYVEVFHNRQRRHSALGMLTPIEYENMHHAKTA